MDGEIRPEMPVAGFVAPVLEIVTARRRTSSRPPRRLHGPANVTSLPPRADWSPAVNLFDTGSAYILIAELAGVGPDSLRIELDPERDRVTLRGSRVSLPYQVHGTADSVGEEIAAGEFERQVTLPGAVDGTQARAVCRYGLLELLLPKLPGHDPKRLPLRSQRRERRGKAC